MAIPHGVYRLGPEDGTLAVRTRRTGAAAKAGHNLLLHATAWEATLELAGDAARSRLELDVDATSLRVREGTGGMQSLGEDDMRDIEKTIDDEVLQRRDIAFRSRSVEPAAGGGLHVEGNLTLGKSTRPIAFDVAEGPDGTLSTTLVVKQSDHGIKPYSTLFGALKVVDEVEVAVEARLPRG